MQMIKGTDIKLYSGDEFETVHNVLVGNSANPESTDKQTENGGRMQTFTLAIPKGDTHDWVNRIVEFFGKRFRTVGYPVQGIEENIPLSWHKQVNVQALDVAGYITVFDSRTFTRHVFENAYFYDGRGESLVQGIVTKTGNISVQIYADKFREDKYKPNIGDILVLEKSSFVFDNSSEKSISESMKKFRNVYPDYGVIDSSSAIRYGDIPDYVLTAV